MAEKRISNIKRKTVILGPTSAVCHPRIQKLCLCPYFNHPKGCPNYGRRPDCPPRAVYFPKIFKDEVRIAAVIFDFEDYLHLRRIEHPDWQDRALRNPRHWQGHLRSELKRFVSEEALDIDSGESEVIFNPEAMGVNVTRTCKMAGLKLEWPPHKTVCQVAIIGQRKDYFKVVREDLTSVGLLGAPQIQYKIGEWVYPLELLSDHPRKGGGLWVYRRECDAFSTKKYLEEKRRTKIPCRVFSCRIGRIIYEKCRTKTDKVMLLEEL